MIALILKLLAANPFGMLGGAALISAVLAGGAAWTVQGWRLDAVKAEHELFIRGVEYAGEVREERTRVENSANRKAKERADAEHARTKRDLDALYAAYRGLRDQDSRRSLLPGPETAAGESGTASFDRGALDRALSTFDRGITDLLREGDQALADLDNARRWAQDR